MKTIQEYEEDICKLDCSWSVKSAARATRILYHFRDQINRFSEAIEYESLDISANQISLSTDDRNTTLAFLRAFGGDWNKEPNTYYNDRIDYVQKIPHPFDIPATVEEGEEPNEPIWLKLVVSSPPPPACKIEEYEEAVPASIVKKKRVVCPQSVKEELAEVTA